MALRKTIVEVDTAGLNVADFCRQHGISTWFFWDLRRRFAREGEAVLEPKSRAPLHVANRTSAAIEAAIIAKRKELEEAGLDAGPASIAFHLRDLDGCPSEATIWRILKAGGFIEPQPNKAPGRAVRSFTAERANDCWQLDDTTWVLADGTPVKILNVIDDHSRLLVASVALGSCTGAAALAALASAAVVLGWPARFLSDNAKAFRHVLAEALRAIAGSATATPGPTTPRRTARSSGSTSRSSSGSPASGRRRPSQSSRPSSTSSATSTTTSGRTGPSNGSSQQRCGPPRRRAGRVRTPSAPPPWSTTALSTAWVWSSSAGATTSVSAWRIAASPRSRLSPARRAMSSSTAASSDSSRSTRPGAASPVTVAAYREGCLATPVRDVPRHDTRTISG